MHSVIAVSGDPGGANALAPVIKTLNDQGRVTVRALAYNEARDVWSSHGINPEELAGDVTRSDIVRLLKQAPEGLLLTGTSINAFELEKQFVAVAREIGMPSLAVLDFWSNYRVRFGNSEGSMTYVPDRIAVMDDNAKREMIEEGFEEHRLKITGQPAFDDLTSVRNRFTEVHRKTIREALQIGVDELLVLFASQPLAQVCGVDDSNALYQGYTEHGVLRPLIPALERISQRVKRRIALLIRPHPREPIESFERYQSDSLRILVSKERDRREVAMASDLVTGMTTILLVEACYLGCIVLSLQPGQRGPDPLPTNRFHLSYPVYQSEQIEPVVEEMLLDSRARNNVKSKLAKFSNDGGATRRVVDLTYQMMGIS